MFVISRTFLLLAASEASGLPLQPLIGFPFMAHVFTSHVECFRVLILSSQT